MRTETLPWGGYFDKSRLEPASSFHKGWVQISRPQPIRVTLTREGRLQLAAAAREIERRRAIKEEAKEAERRQRLALREEIDTTAHHVLRGQQLLLPTAPCAGGELKS